MFTATNKKCAIDKCNGFVEARNYCCKHYQKWYKYGNPLEVRHVFNNHKAHPLFEAYHSMRQRCLNPNNPSYKNYGGRGITISPSWLGKYGFDQFVKDVGSKPSLEYSLDRIDNNKGYEASNIRWATRKLQNRNKRTNNKDPYVHWVKQRNKWKVCVNGIYHGIFGNYLDAVSVARRFY